MWFVFWALLRKYFEQQFSRYKKKKIYTFVAWYTANSVYSVDIDVDGVYERRLKPLCPHLEITLQ